MKNQLFQFECTALLFDLDGTLVDSSVCVERHWQRWAAKHRLDLAQIMRLQFGRRSIETMRLVAPHLDLEQEAAEFGAAEAVDPDGLVVLAGAAELLAALPADRWGIVTSCPRLLATNRLTWAGLPVPPVLITSEAVVHGKPAPDPYLLGAQKLGVPPTACLAVEDAPAGITAARRAHMQVLAITTTHAPSDLSDADYVIDTLAGLQITQKARTGEPPLLVHVSSSAIHGLTQA